MPVTAISPCPAATASVGMGDGMAAIAFGAGTVGVGSPPTGMVNESPTPMTLGSVKLLAAMMSSTLTSYCWLMRLSVSPACTVWTTGASAAALSSAAASAASGAAVPDGGAAMLGVGSTPGGSSAVAVASASAAISPPRLSHQKRMLNTTTAETMTFRKRKGSI